MFKVSRTGQSVEKNQGFVGDVGSLSGSLTAAQMDALNKLKLSAEQIKQIMEKTEGLLILKKLIADGTILQIKGFSSQQLHRIANCNTGLQNLNSVRGSVGRLIKLKFSITQIVDIVAQEYGFSCLQRILDNEVLLFQDYKCPPSSICQICTNKGKFTKLIKSLENRKRLGLPDENECPQKRRCTRPELELNDEEEGAALWLHNMRMAASSQTGTRLGLFQPLPADAHPSYTDQQTEHAL